MEACQHTKKFHVKTIFRWPDSEFDTITGETEMSGCCRKIHESLVYDNFHVTSELLLRDPRSK